MSPSAPKGDIAFPCSQIIPRVPDSLPQSDRDMMSPLKTEGDKPRRTPGVQPRLKSKPVRQRECRLEILLSSRKGSTDRAWQGSGSLRRFVVTDLNLWLGERSRT
jgi:hypothetical protein